MAQRRMFSQRIVGDENFLEMPQSAQNLYFHLGIYADDDGFINPKKIVRMIGANPDDLKILVAKKFVIPFESGVVVITHWKENNYLRSDRYNETIYLEEKAQISENNGSYLIGIPEVNQRDTQVRLGKVRLGKVRLGKVRLEKEKGKREKNIIPPSLEMVQKYCTERNNGIDAQNFIDRNTATGWVVGKTRMKDWQAAIRTWENNKKKWDKDKPQVDPKTQEAIDLVKECEAKYGMETGAETAMFRFARKYGDQEIVKYKGIFKL